MDLFNPEPKTPKKKARNKRKKGRTPKKRKKKSTIEDLDSGDELAGVDIESMPKWNPPLSERRHKKARKHIARRDRILAVFKKETRITWKLTDLQVQMIFDFFTSSKCIQNVAFGIVKKKDSEGRIMCMPKVIRLHNKTDLGAEYLLFFSSRSLKMREKYII